MFDSQKINNDPKPLHEWHEVAFSYGSWIECACGFKPNSQEEFDNHPGGVS